MKEIFISIMLISALGAPLMNATLKSTDESTVVSPTLRDITSTGAEAWYDPLPPGKYELSIQRRLDCCDGPMVDSNKISFEVMP